MSIRDIFLFLQASLGRISIYMVNPLLRENFNVSLKSIASSRLRSILTILIIAIGITSLVGILTATDSLKAVMSDNFGKMGANSFRLRERYSDSESGRKMRVINRRNITYSQARSFVENYKIPSTKTIFATALSNATIKSGSEATNPSIRVVACDEQYAGYSGVDISKGRGFNIRDMEAAAFSAIIGSSIAWTLFRTDDPVGRVISVGAVRYEVVGVMEVQGNSFGRGVDSEVWIPITNGRATFLNDNTFFSVGVVPQTDINQTMAIDAAEQLFRSIRRLSPADVTDFRITRSDALLEDIMKIMSYVTIAAFAIGFITLLGAAVGLMNIMLVAVKERTREIGTRKALGATSAVIKQQFLFESIIIGQLGGIFGILLGVLIGNLTALLMGASFIVPWLWIICGVLICLGVSVLSGYLPAVRASKLDPIEALRYE